MGAEVSFSDAKQNSGRSDFSFADQNKQKAVTEASFAEEKLKNLLLG
jgi:hypothetical protein